MNASNIPEIFSHYRILKKLGAGGMGEVYLAEDTRLYRKVAIKFLPLESVTDDSARRRLIREAQAAAKLDHPNICSVHEVAEEEGRSFIVMQYVEGQNLAGLIHSKHLELRESLDVAVQLADALAQAHSEKVIHRDVKPANIMITARGQVKVLDFGLAELIQDKRLPDELAQTESVFVQPSVIAGTLPYMSPEQVRGDALDARSDIFSVGVVLYEMVSGVRPFAGQTAPELIAAILTDEPKPLARYSRAVPAELERIISKALRKDREERYQTIKDMLLDLRNLRDELAFEAKLERSGAAKSTGSAGIKTEATGSHSPGRVEKLSVAKIESKFANGMQRHKLLTAAVVVMVAASAVGYFFFVSERKAAIDSIAVLPFVNASGSADVEYLSDGMTESLINSLSQLPNVSVKARSTVFRYKGKEVDPQQIGSELNVQAVLNARVVQHGELLSLNLELVHARTGNQIWGQQYNRKLTDLVSLQSEITSDVLKKLQVRLSGVDEKKVKKNYTENVEAYQHYLKGRYHAIRLTPREAQKGISYYQQAIDIDPSYALAYVGLADAYRTLPVSADLPSTELFPKAKAAVQKAIEIDDTLAEAHAALGAIIFWYEWNWNEAENQFKRALELNPNSANSHLYYAHLLSETGRHEQALAEMKRTLELDPLSIYANALDGQFLIHAGKADEGLARLQKTFELEPNYWLAHLFASSAYIEKGMFAEAVAESRKSMQEMPESSHAVAFNAFALAKAGNRSEARTVLEKLLKSSTERYVPPYTIALIYHGLDEDDEALAWLERGYEQRDPRMVFLRVEPKWHDLLNDPRFQDLLRRLNLPL